MVQQWRRDHEDLAQHHVGENADHPRICICVRKRPISDKERQKNDHDSVTCVNPEVWIHSAKLRVDGISKYLDHSSFQFDHAFGDDVSTDEVYRITTMPLIDFVCSGTGGRATVFAYGQTGSGKTHTMNGIQDILCEDLYMILSEEAEGICSFSDTVVMISFFEMYGGFIQDLLNDRKRLKVLEDGKGEVVMNGLQEIEAESPKRFLELVQQGNNARTTHTTEANDTSSRSHAICQITLRHRTNAKLLGKLSLVDLAGSERGTDTQSHNAQRRAESSDINTSLLALKECIRALDRNAKGPKHVPYRASKLTLILKDCFTSDRAMTTMIVTVSPGASAADHSLNTLRYADRVKEKRGQNIKMPTSTRRQSSSHLGTTSGNEPKQLLPGSNDKAKPTTIPDSAPVWTEGKEVSSDTASVEFLQDTVLELFEKEEVVLNMHMNFIAENAQLLSKEGALLQQVQKANVSKDDIERYVSALESILDCKEDMILALQNKLAELQSSIEKQ
jgi:kinesin family member 2/24